MLTQSLLPLQFVSASVSFCTCVIATFKHLLVLVTLDCNV